MQAGKQQVTHYDLTNLRQSPPILAASLPQINGGQNDGKRKKENSTSFTYDLTNLKQSLPILATPSPRSMVGRITVNAKRKTAGHSHMI